MKKINILLSVLLSLFVLSQSYAQDENQTTGSSGRTSMATEQMTREITDQENLITQAVENKDVDRFGSFLANDFQAVYNSGIFTKDEEIQRVQKMDVKNIQKTDEKVVFPADNVAILTYKSSGSRTVDGKDVTGTYNVSSTFVKRNGKWVVVEHTMVKSGQETQR